MSPEQARPRRAGRGRRLDRGARGQEAHQGLSEGILFDPSLTEAPVGSLSGGERSRLLLAREFARASNLLVLDEPTNDLDLETLDLLQEVIADYDGTVLIVSHDRDFLDQTVTVTLGLDGSGKVDIVAGGYEDWGASVGRVADVPKDKERQALTPTLSRKRARGRARSSPTRTSAISTGCRPKSSGSKREIAAAEDALHDPDLYARNPAKFDELTRKAASLRADKDAAELRWLEVAEMAEQMTAAR